MRSEKGQASMSVSCVSAVPYVSRRTPRFPVRGRSLVRRRRQRFPSRPLFFATTAQQVQSTGVAAEIGRAMLAVGGLAACGVLARVLGA